MGSEWTEYSLGDLGRIVTGKTPSKREEGNFGDEVPFVTPRDLDGSRNIETTERYLSEQGANTIKNAIVPPNSIAVSCIGSDMGKAAIVKRRSVTNQQINSIILDGDFDYSYVYYVLSTRKQEIRDAAGGSAQPILNKSHFSQLPILIPPLPEQKAIAHILGTLDDKIELNRRMNATLEGMAQALFKSWFVDFDPVIDNALAAGNPIPDELAPRAEVRRHALANGTTNRDLSAVASAKEEAAKPFPAAFQETESMGWIPEGWEVKQLDELIKLIGGGTPKTSVEEYWNGDIPWFSVVDAPNDSDVFVIDTEKTISEEGLKNSSTKMLRPGTTIISARGTVGKCALIGVEMTMNQSCYGIQGADGASDSYTYYSIRHYVADLQQRGHGSVFNTITRDTFRSIKVPFGSVKLTEAFENQVTDLLARIKDNLQEQTTLTKLRDALLPKLISGELRIPEAEQLTKEALA